METLVERCAGLGRAQVFGDRLRAGARRPWWALRRDRRFTTTTADLSVVAEWLASQLPGDPGGDGVDRVLLEAGRHLLEDQVECWLLNAAHMHNVSGRNADDADAAWIA